MGAGDDIKAFFVDNIWATILIAVGVVLIIVVLVWYCIRRRRRRGYVSLESSGSTSVQTFLMTETMRKTRDETQAELLNCQYYLRSHPEFELETPLGPIGSRVNKGWFAVTHHGQRKLLYTLPRSTRCCFPFDAPTERTLREMFHILHHPYVLPIHHVGFISGQDMAVVVLPFAMKGSLKDVIHHSNPLQVWDRKYTRLRPPLPLKQIALIGRQVLEGLEYLSDKGIYHNNVHSGNIIMMDNIPKLTGYENALFGYRSRLSSLVRPLVPKKGHPDTRNVLGFGHVLFEMATGCEATEARPSVEEITTRCNAAAAEALAHIFYHPETRVPTCLEVKSHPLFARIQVHELPEIMSFRPKPFVLSSGMKKLIAAVASKRPIKPRPRKRRVSRETSFSTSSVTATPRKAAPAASTAPTQQATPSRPPQQQQPQQQQVQQPQPQQRPQQQQVQKQQRPASSEGRGALLSSIRQGKSLRKAKTNDRSAPRV